MPLPDFGPDFNVAHDAPGEDTGDGPADPEAPYGRNPKTGKPYRYSAEERARRAQVMNEARWGKRPAAVKAPGRTSSSTSKAKSGRTDYRAGIEGLAQLVSFGVATFGRVTNKPAFALDSLAIGLYAPGVAEAVDELAQQQAWLAAALDKALAVGPYGALLGVGIPLAMQLAANHGAIPTNPDLGILDGEALVAAAGAKK